MQILLNKGLQCKHIICLKSIFDEIEIKSKYYLKLFAILYADATIVLSESQEDLQKQLDTLNEYCNI